MAKNVNQTVVTVANVSAENYKSELLVLGLFAETKKLPAEYKMIDDASGGIIGELIRLGDFSGKANETLLLYPKGKLASKRLLIVGLGDKNKFELNVLREAAGIAAKTGEKVGAKKCSLLLHALAGKKFGYEKLGQAIAEGAIVGRYAFKDYVSSSDNVSGTKIGKMDIIIVESSGVVAKQLKAGCDVGVIVGESQNQARMIANKPGNEINPATLAKEAQKLARKWDLNCQVFDEKKLAKLGMNAILAVGSGSANKPRLIVLRYQGNRDKKTPDVAVVGKAITFDSGGICIKPSSGMEAMKFDKCGGCAVLGIMEAVSRLKLKLNVIGLIPSAENLPSQTSYRPGDIIRTYSGKTVEVQNTDAEGRMILSDALNYVAKMKPKAIIDMATLTGACVIALGNHYAGLFSNDEKLAKSLLLSGVESGEKVWRLPCGEEYLEQMKSKVADLKNIGGREGGPCTAGAFLGEFVEGLPWAHIDIAGMADTNEEKPYRNIGATGFPVRLIVEYLRTQVKS